MTGIADVVHRINRSAWHTAVTMGLLAVLDTLIYLLLPERAALWLIPRVFAGRHAYLKEASLLHPNCPRPRMPDQRKTLALLNGGSLPKEDRISISSRRPRGLKWGIILPLTSRAIVGEEEGVGVWARLEANARLLAKSVDSERRSNTKVYVGIDMRDPVFDNDDARARIRGMYIGLGGVDFVPSLPPAYQGAICWIWALLAKRAVDDGADLFVLLGDDIAMHDPAWQEDVEERFAEVATERGLPFGCACVAIRDIANANFPTFPVMHRFHLDAFGELFPPEFRNQHGDPFLYEVYRRWGASCYTEHATLTNAVGGFGTARYVKAGENLWRNSTLTVAIERLDAFMKGKFQQVPPQVPCIDVVVPTYRCDVDALKELCSLECQWPGGVAIHTTLVVDRPETDNLNQLLALASYAPNRTVRVHVMETNSGASNARNAGLWQSFGDHAIMLDDDVIPDPGLVDAYLSAIERHPGAAAYVGLTRLPDPETLMQHAMVACRICYFYGVALEQNNPPWGVTANLCVPARCSPISFARRYPKTGGGEDVDYCIRSKKLFGPCVAVSGASVLHPYWDRPLPQVVGWACGDTLCLDAMPQVTFRAMPNWAEIGLLCVFFCRFDLIALMMLVEIALLVPRSYGNVVAHRNRIVVAITAAIPPMLQDVTRLQSKLRRLRLSQMCLHFDWMDGAGRHISEKQINSAGKFVFFVLATVVVECEDRIRNAAVCCLVGLYTLWWVGQADLQILPKILRQPTLTPELRGIELRADRKLFVIFGYQRTGSNLLCSYLGRHPAVAMHYELFNDKGVYMHDRELSNGDTVKERDNEPAEFLSRMYNIEARAKQLGGGQPECVGFKVFPEHMCRSQRSRKLFEDLLADPRVHKIILRRENRIAVCASAMRASVTGAYIKADLNHVQVHIKPDEAQEFIDTYDRYYKYVKERVSGQQGSWTELTYEELVDDPKLATRRV